MFSEDLQQLNHAHQRQVIPALYLIEQSSHKHETYEDPDFDAPVRVIVKNAPLRLKIGTLDRASKRVGLIDLHQVKFELSLVYASPTPEQNAFSQSDLVEEEKEKVVAPPGFDPLVSKVEISDRGDEAFIDCRIRVLTSQHEQSLFQISIDAVNPETLQTFTPALQYLSDPIKVISKPEQQKPHHTPISKGVTPEKLAEVVERIEKQHAEQSSLLQQLLDRQPLSVPPSLHQHSPQPPLSIHPPANFNSALFSFADTSEPPATKTPESAFEEAFSTFIDHFISSSSKSDIVRNLLKTSTPSLRSDFSKFLDDLESATTFQRQSLMDQLALGNSFPFNSSPQCACGHECPYAKELERVDVYYRDFLSSDFPRPE